MGRYFSMKKTYNDDLVVKRNIYDGRRSKSLADALNEPRVLGTALHGFGLGGRVVTDEEWAKIEKVNAEYHRRRK
jgi:hypothetical protein